MAISARLGFTLFLFAAFSTAAPAEPVFEEPAYIRSVYKGQPSFHCGGKHIKLPGYFPFTDDAFYAVEPKPYLIAESTTCSSANVTVYLGLGPDCTGQHLCTHAYFSRSASTGILKDEIDGARSAHRETFALAGGIRGYLIPPRCGSYCEGGSILWSDGGMIYQIGSKFADVGPESTQQLVKAANSYIDGN